MSDDTLGRPIEILLVEDNPGDVRLTIEALKEGKVRNSLSVARDGVEALAFLRREGPHANAARPDLILLDLNMPRMNGLEFLRGASTYTYDGNWKVQAENGADGYHVTSVHWNYAATTSRRSSGDSTNTTKAMDAGKWGKQKGGFYSFEHGHLLLWQEWGNPKDRPLWDRREELVEKYGEEMANFMVNISRNLCLYPNVYIMDQFSSQIRVFRPLSADKTEVTIYCIAPVGESKENRANRIRQYEDFFNASGMATPDDLEEFLELRDNTGDEARRTHNLNLANWIPDLFMKRVEVADVSDDYADAIYRLSPP